VVTERNFQEATFFSVSRYDACHNPLQLLLTHGDAFLFTVALFLERCARFLRSFDVTVVTIEETICIPHHLNSLHILELWYLIVILLKTWGMREKKKYFEKGKESTTGSQVCFSVWL